MAWPRFDWFRVLCLGGGIMAIWWLSSCAQVALAPGSLAGAAVIIDAGHGGKDSGGTSGNSGIFLREKDLTLDTALKVRDQLRKAGVRVLLTRSDDHFIELDDRVAFANRQRRPVLLVSIHYDAVGSSVPHGAKVFFWRADSHGLATRIQRHLVSETDEADLGVIRRRLRLTRNPDIPCVLCECAYVTNPAEARRAADPAYRSRIALGISRGIVEEMQRGDAGIPAVPEIYAPLSKASDAHVPSVRHHSHGHP